MRLQRMEGQDGVTKGRRVGGWTGSKASHGPLERTRVAETSLGCCFQGPISMKNALNHDRSLERTSQGSQCM